MTGADPRPLRVHVPVLRHCTTLVPVGYVDMLQKAAGLAASLALASRCEIDVRLVSATGEREVEGVGGVRLCCDAVLDDVDSSDLVLVPALDPDVCEHLELNRDVVPWLRRLFLGGADVASACTGAFLLAEAGLLDGPAATTHWAFQDDFRRRYPRVRLEPQAIVVDQGRVLTAGGATSFLSLTLYVVERVLGPDVARAASKFFLVDVNKSPQGAYAMFGSQKTHGDGHVLRAQDIIERDLALNPSVDELAGQVAMSRRNFGRRFKNATGNSPRDYLHRVRVEAAKRALEGSQRPVSAIAGEVGYDDVVAFRKLFVRLTGLTPTDYRARYGLRTTPALVSDGRPD